MAKYSIGIDYGTNSVRALVVDIATGQELGTTVCPYPSGDEGIITDPADHNLARQSPADWLYGLEKSVCGALAEAQGAAGFDPADVIGIGVDTTGSTPLPVDAKLKPIVFCDEFKDNKNAQAWLWKDHTSVEEAARITEAAKKERPQFLAKCGGTYSSEWFFAKVWHCLNVDPAVFKAAHTWVEFADWVPAMLAGITDVKDLKPGVCAAGHKAMYNDGWGGLPDKDFLAGLAPELGELRTRLFDKAYPSDVKAGALCEAWAGMLGLPAGIPIAVGAFDAHMGAVGSGVSDGVLSKIIGTSTCDIMVAPESAGIPDIPGVCGIVNGSVLPGYLGIEAGQSAVGDIFNWFVKVVCRGEGSLHEALTADVEEQKPGQSGLLALDWNNGNRTILVDQRLTGLLLGQTLHTTRQEIYRALIEGTAYGARAIVERIGEYGVKINKVICCGGIAEKNPMLMQIYADVLGMPMEISRSAQTCALGAAIFGSVVAGAENGGHDNTEAAQKAICGVKDIVYKPIAGNQKVYDRLYGLYKKLHDAFGVAGHTEDLSVVMKALLEIKGEQA